MSAFTRAAESRRARARRWTLIGSVLTIVTAAVLAGCTATSLEPPAQAVQDLLELRSTNSTDVAGYTRYVQDASLADALAQDAAARTSGGAVPPWEPPVVESSSEQTAAVAVVWRPDEQFPDWPKSTTFLLEKVDGRWLIVDATEDSEAATATVEP